MTHRFCRTCLAAAILWSPLASAAPREASVEPPWSAPLVSGVDATVPGADNVPDLHGDVNDPQLVVFFAGNQYMLVNELLAEFQKAHPEYRRVFAETLPPGILARQVEEGALVIGNMRITLHADVFTAGSGRMRSLQEEHGWFSGLEDYARNRLAIMTYAGNPAHVTSWRDLARPDLKICMPNPEYEGIAQHAIIPALEQTAGEKWVDAIYGTKVADGTTFLTQVHHRQTPMKIMARECAAGAVWYTEAYFHAEIAHHPLALVTLPDAENKTVTYAAGVLRNAPHPEAAAAFVRFMTGPRGQALYRKYGFLPPPVSGGQ
jgi:molybdate transport system substrate-binding protein